MGIFVLLSFGSVDAATITSTRTGGNWNDPSAWVGGVVPSNGDDVTIASGSTVVINSDAVVGTLTVTGVLQYDSSSAYTLTASEFITVNAEGVFRSASSGTIKNHRLIARGSVINNGIIDFSSNANETGVELVFTGPGNAIFNCSDAVLTNLRQENGITLDKGTSAASVLSFIPGKAFQVLSDGSSSAKGFLTIENGTFNVIGSKSFRNPVFSADGTYTIPASGGFWLGNQNAEITSMNGQLIIHGELKVTNGIFNTGTSVGSVLKTEGNGNLKISGGVVNVAGKLRVDGGVCSISGGRLNLAMMPNSADTEPALNVSAKAKLEVFGTPLITITYPNSGQQLANDILIQEGSGSKFISGGAIQLGTEATPAQSIFLVSGERIIPYLTAFSECSTVAYNTSKADIATTQVTALPRIALDKTAPEITVPEKVTIKCGETVPPAYASLTEFSKAGGAVSDNCAVNPVGFKLVKEVRSKVNCPYIITRTYEVSDASGNTATAENQIQVEGNIVEPQAEPVAGQPIAQELKLKSATVSFTAVKSGDWDDPATWSSTVIPTSTDDVIIPGPYTVTIDAAAVCNDITINSGGVLTYNGTNTLTVNGNWTNNGTYTGGTSGIVEFAGTSNAIISGSTNFEELKINKASLNTTLTINGTVTVTGGGSLTMAAGLITIPAGGSFAVNPSSGLTIQKPAGFDLTGGTLNTGNFTITNEGLIRVSSGTANLGSGSGNAVHTQVDGAFIVSGGNVNLSGRLENSASGTLNPPGVSSGISISGGTITLATVGNGLSGVGTLNVTSAGTFNFTGGTIVFQNESTATTAIDLGLNSGTGAKTTVGGTFQFGNVSTPAGAVFNISSEILLNRITSAANADIKLLADVSIGQLAIDPGTTIDLNGNALRLVASSIKTYTFPIDNGSGVQIPVTIDLTSGTFGANPFIEIETFGSKYPSNESDLNYLNRYWTITTSGITSPVYNVTAKYADADVAGTDSEIAMGSYGGSLPWVKYGNANSGANTLSANGITTNSFTFTGITSDPPTVSVAATPSTICIGASSNLTANPVGDFPFTYLWAPTTGLSNPNIINPVATPGSTTTYTVTVTDGNGFTASGTATIIVNPANTVSAASSTPTLCISTPLTAITHTTTGATGIGAPTGLPSGVTAAWASNTITISGTPIVTGTFNYSIPLTGGCGNVAASGTITVNPAPAVSITANPGNTICSGDNVNFTTNVTNAGTTPSFQWYINGISVSGANGSTFSSTTLANTQKVSVVVTADPTYCSATANSNIITMTVNPSVIPTVSILESANNICSGSSVTFASTVVNGGSAPTYQWQLNGTPVSLATGSSFTSNTLVNGDQVRVVVTSNANCAINNPATSNTITITVNPVVTPSVSIVADNTTICPGATVSFTATPVNGGSNPVYQWKINGVNAGTNSSTFTISSLIQGDKVTVVMTSSIPCASPTLATSNEINMTVNPGTPAIPGAIAGLNPVCPSMAGQIYSVAAVPGATTYNWTLPSGWTGASTTNSITVTTGAAGQNGNITVSASNSCGTSAVRTLAVTVNPGTPATPGPISGTASVCPAISGLTYSVAAVTNATSYTWTLPSGWTGTSTTNTITVTSGSAGQNGTISVTATNSCGTSATSTLAVIVNPGTPAQPGAITGNASVCPATAGLVYSVAAVPNATSYTWTLPSGWTGTSTTNSITVTSGSAGQNGNITVSANSTCGTSPAQTLAVTVNPGAPATPGAIAGTVNQCINASGLVYSIAAVPNATTYNWTLPSGWTGSSTTNTITIATNGSAVSGNITVTASNTCGTSSSTTLAVTASSGTPGTPAVATGPVSICPVATGLIYSVPAVAGATSYTWTVPTGWTITSGIGTNTITANVSSSASTGSQSISVAAKNACGTGTASALTVTVGTFAFVDAGPDVYLCSGSISVNYAAAVGGAISGNNDVQWTSSSGAQKQRFSSNGTSATGTYDFIAADITAGIVTLTITSNDPAGTCVAVSDQFVVRILSNPTAIISGTTSICSGGSASITFTATPNTTVTYAVNGGSNQTVSVGAAGSASVNTGAITANAIYSLVSVAYTATPTCSQSASGSATITVNPAATVSAGAPQTICAGSTATMAGVIGGSATSATWTSSRSGTFNNNNALNAIYTPSVADITAGSVTLTFTTNDPSGPCGPASSSMILTINPVATVNAGATQTICAGSTATMAGSIGGSATAANWSGGGGTFSPNNTTLNAVYTPSAAEILAGITTLTLTSDDPAGPCGQVSSTVTLVINPVATANAGADQVVCASAPIILAGSVGGGASSGTWSGGLGTFSPNNTTLTATYSPTAAEIADGVVTLTLTTNDPAGPCGAVSDQVRITINPAATVNAGLDQSICQGSFIVMSGTIGGAATSATWSGGAGTFSPNNTTLNATYTPGAGETGSVTLTLTTSAPNASCPAVSDQVVITIDPKPLVTVSPNQMICSNGTATITGTFSGGATTATWSTSGSGTFSNISSPTAVYTPGNSDIFNGTVTLTYTTDDPPGLCGPASASLVLTVKKVIVITSEPVNTGVCATKPADLIVTAAGDNLTYQWYKGVAPGGTPVVNSANISGAQSATLHFNNATSVDDGSYYVVISSANACSSETSTTVTLNVDEEITVTTQLLSNSVCIGDPVTFKIVAEPGGVLTYQWRKDGVNITGQTSNTLNLGNVTLTDAGNYDVQIKGMAGYTCSDAQSALATLVVNGAATLSLTSAAGTNAQNGCISQPITDITYAVGGGATNASVTGLPTGVTGTYNTGVFTISGTPTATGTFSYTINTTGNCTQTSTTGTIAISPSPTISLGTPSMYCPGATSFALPYTATTGSPVTYSISAGTPALAGFVPVVDAALGASPINVTLPAGVSSGTYQFNIVVKNNIGCPSVNQTFSVTFRDVTPPVAPTLPAITAQCSVTLTPPGTIDNALISIPTATDDCSGTVTGTTTTTFPYTTTGTHNIVWTFTDASGNTTSTTQVVTINDQTAPTWATFPTDKTLECGSALNTTPAATGSPTATDNCSAVVITMTENTISGTCPSRYTIKRTWKATDASGNAITKDQIINVEDTTPPIINCTSYTNFNANQVPASDLHVGVTATDNCSPAGAIMFELISEEYFGLDNVAGFCPSSLERVYRAVDACGNFSGTCTQTYTFTPNPNCQACIDDPNTTDDNVPFFPVIFSQPDQSWTSPNVVRNGVCCWAEGPPPPRCISFNVYLHPDAVGLIFTIPTGAIPGGALYYHVDCGPPQKVGEVLCLSGGRFYTITFCEPGNNPNTYTIESIKGAAVTDDIITRADANCIKNVTVSGLEENSFLKWTVKYPVGADTLLNRLSCTNCLTPVFTPNAYTPPTIIYQVCGQVRGSYLCNSLPVTDCAELTVTTLPAIDVSFNVDLDNICEDEIPGIDATITPGGYAYLYEWYDGPDGTGNLLSTNSTWTPTTQGDYSLVVTENQSGVSCNRSVHNFNITFDYIGPSSLTVPPPLQIDCNLSTSAFDVEVAKWLASATASDTNVSSIPVKTDFYDVPFVHSCGAIKTVTFSASDNCGNTTTATSEIRIIDTTPPVITTPATNQTVQCDGAGNSAALNSWLSSSAGSVATDACGGTISWTNNYSALSDLCGATGVATVTFTATDACGNASTTVATFTIVDTTPPVISCPGPVSGIANTAECFATGINLGTATATDNCSTASVTNNAPAQFPVGVTTVTWTATDACGNIATCTQLVTILDNNQPPTITCPTAVQETIAADQCSKTGVNPGAPTIWDNCPNPVLTYTLSGVTSGSGVGVVSNTTFNVGVTTITYTVTDAGGGTASCSFSVWIKRLNIPAATVTCTASPAPVDAAAGTCSAPVTLTSPLINDPCNAIVSVVHNSAYGTSASDASGTYPVGTTTVTWTITDTSGNVMTCTQTVIVRDMQPPSITCPQDAVDQITNGGCNLLSGNVQTPTISDNCGIASLTYVLTGATNLVSPATGTNYANGITYGVGVTTVTYTVTDVNGLTASCTHTVWIKNLNAPKFSSTQPANVSEPADAGVCQAIVTVPSPGINNPCNEVYSSINNSPYKTSPTDASGTYPVGTTTITWVVTDASGSKNTYTQTVTVVDTQTPTITCPQDAVDQITNGGCNLLSGNVQTPTISDNCSIASLTYVLSGATNLVSSATGINYANGVTYNVGVTTVTYTVTDVNGLTASCTHTVWIRNLNAPKFDVTCRTGTEQNMVVPADPGVCEADVTVLSPIITNPCNEVYTITNNITGTATATGTYQVGTTTITWTIKDASGNLYTCTQTVNVVDTQTPTISCPVDVIDQITNGGCNLVSGNVQTPTISDNCGIASLTYELTGATNMVSPSTGINYANGITYNIGVTSVTYTVTDVNGLTASCTHTVWIRNLNAPKFSSTQPSNVSVPADPGECQADVTVPSPGINNPCNELYTVVNDSPYQTSITNASGTYPIGTTTVTWVVTDASGSKTTYTQTVTVVDTQVPSFTSCPDDIEEPADFEKLFATNVDIPVQPTFIADNCTTTLSWTIVHETTGTVSSSVTTGINYVPTPYPQLDLGVNTFTYQLSDDSGNTSTCTFTVTITAKPVIDCPADIVTNTTASDCTQTLNPGVPELISGSQPITWTWTITDPTGGLQESGTFSGTVAIPGPPDLGDKVFKEGTSTITWTATNLAGTTSCTHTVSVIDNVKPTFNLPAAFSECVERIQDATFDAPTIDITPTRPEYYILEPGDISLDLTGLWDNCCATTSLTVHWRIEFTDTTDPAAPPAILHINPITGTGQLSAHGTPILFPGDGVTFNNVIHKIFYWLEDCHGNVADEQEFPVTIRPRPQIIKMN